MFTTDTSFLSFFLIVLSINGYIAQYQQSQPSFRNINDVDDFLRDYGREAAEMCNRVATAEWRFATNSTDYNRRRVMEQQSIASKFECLSWKRAASFDVSRLLDTSTKRQFEKILRRGKCGLDEDRYQEITHLISVMKDAFKSAKICPYKANSHVYVHPHNGEQNKDLPYNSNYPNVTPQNKNLPYNPLYSSGPQYNERTKDLQYNQQPYSRDTQYNERNRDLQYNQQPYSRDPQYSDRNKDLQYNQQPYSRDTQYNERNRDLQYNPPPYSTVPQYNEHNKNLPYNPLYPNVPRAPQYNEQNQDLQYSHPPYPNYCDLRLDPELTKIMEVSRNEDELLYVWASWHDKTGPPLKNSFMRYTELANQAARIQGFRDAGDQMRSVYDDPDLFFTVQDLWTQIQPLYKKLFTFVRKGLVRKYGEAVIRNDGPIPAHILGDMWGQNWRNILDIIRPEMTETPDVTGEMVRQGYNPLKIFQGAEEFFTSMGLPPMSPEFWRNSMLSNNDNGYTHCPASAWDFCNNIDFRIKQCTHITVEDFVKAHKEMTHIQYYMQYSTQPFVYRDGPNPAFQEAIANTIGLSVGGPVHLQRIGLLTSPIPTSSGNSLLNIEYLLDLALDKLPFMAFSVALEKWRWFVFEKGPIGLNARWWDMRLRYQGIVPPTQRTLEHFDAGSKYDVVSDQDYIKYFIATVLQFQMFSELCQASGHVGPLHTCDIYRSREAGRLIGELMQHGASLSSSQLIRLLTRGKSSRLSALPLSDYFRPLEVWLDQQIRYEPVVGWNSNMADVALFQYISSGGHASFDLAFGLLIAFCTAYLPRSLFC